MSASSFSPTTLLFIAAGAGLVALAVSEATDDAAQTEQQEANTFRSRVFDVSPTHGSNREAEQDSPEGTEGSNEGSGQWLSDSLARLEESYQAMRKEGEELAQGTLHALDEDTQPTRAATPATSPPLVEAAPDSALDTLGTFDPNAHVEQDAEPLADAALPSEQAEASLDASAPVGQDPAQPAAASQAAVDPEQALRDEQLRIAVQLEKHQAFIISLLPLFLPVPMAADGSVPDAGQAAAMPVGAPVAGVDMSGLVVGPIDMVAVSNP